MNKMMDKAWEQEIDKEIEEENAIINDADVCANKEEDEGCLCKEEGVAK